MITPQTNYDVTKERPNKRKANEFIFQGVSNHANHIGVCFPSMTAGDIKQLAEIGVLDNTARLIAFENGSCLCNSNREEDKPKNWKASVTEEITRKLREILNITNDRQISVITNSDKLVMLSNLYENTLNFGFYDFCHGPGCFAQWLIKRHLNAYKIGADLCFTIAIGGKASFQGIGSFIQNARRANFPISHFGNDNDAPTALVEKTISYLNRWVEFKRVAIYQDKNDSGQGDPMCCFHCVLKKHFEPEFDDAYVVENPAQPPSKSVEFFGKYEEKIKPFISKYFQPGIKVGAKYKKSAIYHYVCKHLPEIMQFQTRQSYKTQWLFEIVDRMYGDEFTRISNPNKVNYWFERNSDSQASLQMAEIKQEEPAKPVVAKEQTTKTGVDKWLDLIHYFESGYDFGKRTFDFKEFGEGKVSIEEFFDCIKAVVSKRNLSMKITLEEKDVAEN